MVRPTLALRGVGKVHQWPRNELWIIKHHCKVGGNVFKKTPQSKGLIVCVETVMVRSGWNISVIQWMYVGVLSYLIVVLGALNQVVREAEKEGMKAHKKTRLFLLQKKKKNVIFRKKSTFYKNPFGSWKLYFFNVTNRRKIVYTYWCWFIILSLQEFTTSLNNEPYISFCVTIEKDCFKMTLTVCSSSLFHSSSKTLCHFSRLGLSSLLKHTLMVVKGLWSDLRAPNSSYSISLLSQFHVSVTLILTRKVSHSTSAFLVSQKPDEQFCLSWNCSSELGGGGQQLSHLTHKT